MAFCHVDGAVQAAPARARLDGAPWRKQGAYSNEKVAGGQGTRLHVLFARSETTAQQPMTGQWENCKPRKKQAAGQECRAHEEQAAWRLAHGGCGWRRRSRSMAGLDPWLATRGFGLLLHSPALLCALLVAGAWCAAGAVGGGARGTATEAPLLASSSGQPRSAVQRRQALRLRDEGQDEGLGGAGTEGSSNATVSQGSLDATVAQGSLGATVAQSSLKAALARGFVRAHPVKVVTVAGHTTEFGFVAVKGTGLASPVVNQKSCIDVTAWTRQGLPFDHGSKQEAFLAGFVTSFDRRLRLVADVAYNAEWSSHKVCFTPPTTGLYAFQLRLGYVNTADLLNELLEANNQGFVNYTVVLESTIKVRAGTGRLDRHFGAYRLSLPRCTPAMLALNLNRGFWLENTWYPKECRLNRLEPSQVLQCFNGKNILMTGDSQTRIYFGLLQEFMSFKTRADFLRAYKGLRYNTGDPIMFMPGIPLIGPYDPTTMQYLGPVNKTGYTFLGVKQTWYGGARVGFTILQGRTKLRQGTKNIPIKFNITFVTYDDSSRPVFQSWMRKRTVTHGEIVTDGGGWPYDKVLVANEIHAVRIFPNAPVYRQKLKSSLLPQLKILAKSPKDVFVYGALSTYESRVLSTNYRSGNPRLEAFETTSLRLMLLKGSGTFLRVRPVTAPRPDLALEGTHYIWPVSLALLDLWLGSSCGIDAYAV